MARQDTKLLTVLHVEDDDNDALLLAKACERAKVPITLHRVSDGEEAKAYMLRRGHFSDPFLSPTPQVIVLDLKLPKTDGYEFLRWLRTQEQFDTLPVLVFTASLSREDKARALGAGASSYFIKPASFEALVQLVECFRTLDGPHLN